MVAVVIKDDIIGYEMHQRSTLFTPGFRHDVGQRPTLEVLHDDPQLLLHQGGLEHLHHVPVLIVPHDHHLQQKQKEIRNNNHSRRLTKLDVCTPLGVCRGTATIFGYLIEKIYIYICFE